MDNIIFIICLAILLTMVHFLNEDIGILFYYIVLLVAFGFQNVFEKYTYSIFISALDIYMDVNTTDIIYYLMVLIITFVYMIVCKGEKTIKSILICAGMPVLILFVLNSKYQFIWIGVAVIMTITIVVLLLQAINLCKHSGKINMNKVKRTLRRFICAIQQRAVIVVLMATILSNVLLIFENKMYVYNMVKVENDIKCRHLDSEVIEKIELYDSMDVNEKIKLLRDIAKIEVEYLGMTNDYSIAYCSLDTGLYGYYENKTKRIIINEEVVKTENFEETLKVILHEIYHMYEYEIVSCIDWDSVNSDLLMLREIKEWKEEQQNYKNGMHNSNYEEYYEQSIEFSARKYAEETVEIYLGIMQSYP